MIVIKVALLYYHGGVPVGIPQMQDFRRQGNDMLSSSQSVEFCYLWSGRVMGFSVFLRDPPLFPLHLFLPLVRGGD